MRKLAMLAAAVLGLAAAPSFAQPNQAGPQPGLPPGAGIGAPNALSPGASGQINTTRVGPTAAAAPDTSVAPPPATTRRRARRARVHHVRHARHHAAPATTSDTPTTNQ